MLCAKQSDVKKHFSARHFGNLHLIPSASEPNGSDASLHGPEVLSADLVPFAEDYFAEHSGSGQPAIQGAHTNS